METTRVILADPDFDRRVDLKKILFQNQSIEIAGEVESEAELLSAVRDVQPELVIISLPLGDADAEEMVEEIATTVPQSEIVVISEEMEDMADARRLLRHGARDYLIRPVDESELLSAVTEITRVSRKRQEKLSEIMGGQAPGQRQRPGKIVSIFSTKGGVGRSLIAVNLAIMLRRLTQQRVALVDLDLQFGDDAILLDMTPTTMIATLARDCKEVESVDLDLLETYMHTHEPSGIDLLAAPPRPEEADYVEEQDVRKILSALRQHYHYVVIDTSSQVTDPVVAALEESDLVLLLLTLELPCIKNGKLMLELMDSLGLSRETVRIIMNRDVPDSEIQIQEIEEALEQEILGGLPSSGNIVMPSIDEGTPVTLSHPDSEFSSRLRDLTDRIVREYFDLGNELVSGTTAGPASTGRRDMNFAPVGTRFLAGLVDMGTAYLLWLIFLVVGIALGTAYNPPTALMVGGGVALAGGLVPLLYITYFNTAGEPMGRRFLGLKLVAENGEEIGLGTSLMRTLLGFFVCNVFTAGLGYLWILFDQNQQGLHDKLVGTYVVSE